MTNVLYLRLYPLKILKERCQPVNLEDPDLGVTIEHLKKTMWELEGAGIAAPQLGKSWNLFIIDMGEKDPRVYLNPKIEELEGEVIHTIEGCLSLPGVKANLNCRHEMCTVSTDVVGGGPRLTLKLFGKEAVVFQHEFDHLEGLTLFDRMGPAQRLMKKKRYMKELAKQREKRNVSK